MWPKQAQFMVRASVRVSDYNLPHWKAVTIAFARAFAMRGETRTPAVYRFVELHRWQWCLTDRTLLHSQSWVNLPFCFLYDRKKQERETEQRLKEWISRPKLKKPVAPPNRWDVFLATSGDTIPCTTFGLFGRNTTAFKRLNAQVVSSTLVLDESIHYTSQSYSHQFSKETFHADGSNSNQFSAISSVTSPFPP